MRGEKQIKYFQGWIEREKEREIERERDGDIASHSPLPQGKEG